MKPFERKILIVDDDQIFLKTMVKMLEKDWLVTSCDSPVEALRRIEEDFFPILLTDFSMNDISGTDLILRTKKISPLTNSIIITADESREVALEAIGAGTYAFLEKSFSKNLLLHSLNRAWDDVSAKLQIKQSEERFRELIEGTDHLITQCDGSGKITYANREMLRVLGLTFEECLGLSAFDFIYEKDRSRTKNWFEECVNHQKAIGTIENRQTSRTGEIFHISWTANFHYNPQGGLERIHSIARDITQHKREERIQAAQLRLVEYSHNHSIAEFLQKFLEEAEKLTNSEISFCDYLGEGESTPRFFSWSVNTEKNYGQAKNIALHDSITNASIWEECIRERKPIMHNDYASLSHSTHPSEEQVPIVREIVFPFFQEDKIVAIFGVGNKKNNYSEQDVQMLRRLSEVGWEIVFHKQAFNQAQALRAELEQIFNNSLPMLMTDLNKRVIRVNQPYLVLFDVLESDILNKKCYEVEGCSGLNTPDCGMSKCTQSNSDNQFTRKYEVGKRTLHCNVNHKALLSAEGQVTSMIITYTDITPLTEWERSYRKQQEQLHQVSRLSSLGTLVAGVAHEINNPNNFIMLSSSRLQKCIQSILPVLEAYYPTHPEFKIGGIPYEKMRSELPEVVNTILSGSHRIKNIVHSLKDFSGSSEEEHLEEVDLRTVVSQSELIIHNQIKNSTDHFKVNLPDDMPRVWGITQKIEQVLINLIQNACLSLGSSDKTISVLVEAEDEQVILSVKDEGCGISEENLKRLMEPFFSTRGDSGGLGLGLSICYGILQNFNATLSFESELEKGTTAKIHLLPVSLPPPSSQLTHVT